MDYTRKAQLSLRWFSFVAGAALTALALASTPVLAQAPVGTISGVVTDASGGVLRGASVTATSLSTGAERVTTANDQGFFTIPSLKPGEYIVTVANKGFANFVVPRVVVEVGQTARVDASMRVEALTENVEVQAGGIAVDTSQTAVSGVVNLKQISELPLNGRNYLELAQLQPGVEIQEGRAFDPTKSRYTGVSIGSRNGREARITIDGVDAVDEHVGTTTLNISQDGIQEFQVSTSSSDPSAGLSATGSINVITKRGSNDLHGSGFLFGRSADFAARPSFAASKPDFDREQFGTSLGGPALKNQIFWFANVEKTNEDSAIGISTPYFPTLTSYGAPFDALSTTLRGDWRVSQQQRPLRPLEPRRQRQSRQLRRQPAALERKRQLQHDQPGGRRPRYGADDEAHEQLPHGIHRLQEPGAPAGYGVAGARGAGIGRHPRADR